jgi:hypothetical protein
MGVDICIIWKLQENDVHDLRSALEGNCAGDS